MKKKNKQRSRKSRRSAGIIEKIPESVDKNLESRGDIINKTVDSMLDALNARIEQYKLSFEEALHATDIIQLSILAKYIDFRIDDRSIHVRKLDRKEGIA